MWFLELFGTKSSSGWLTAALACLLVSLVCVVPAIILLITCNANHGLQQFKGMSVTVPTP